MPSPLSIGIPECCLEVVAVAGHVDFGYDRYASLACIFNLIACFTYV